MLGIVLDVNEFVKNAINPYKEQIDYLKEQLNQMQLHLDRLENLILQRAGFVESDATASANIMTPLVPKIRTWRDQKAILEKKFRPPELAEREERWRKEAENASKEIEVEENAG